MDSAILWPQISQPSRRSPSSRHGFRLSKRKTEYQHQFCYPEAKIQHGEEALKAYPSPSSCCCEERTISGSAADNDNNGLNSNQSQGTHSICMDFDTFAPV